MPSFDLATGYVTFKGSFDQYEADIQKAREKVENLNKSISSGKFEMAARESKRINDEMAKASRNAKRIMDELQLGKMGVFMRDFNAGLNKFAATAGKFGAGATALGGAALAAGAAGSPLAQSTLEGSFKLLATEIGGTFTPLVKDVSRGLQDATKKWHEMSDGIKDMINSGAKFVGVTGLAALGLSALAKGMSLIYKHPLIAALSFVSGGASILNDRLNAAGDKQIDEAQKRNMGDLDFARGDAVTQKLKEMGPAGFKAQMEEVRNAWVDYEAKRKKVENYQKGWFGGGNFYEGMQRAADFTGKYQEGIIGDADKAQLRLEKAKVRLDEISPNKLAKRVPGAGGDAGMLLGSMGPASMTDIQGLFKSFQMAGAGGNQLEAENKKKELQNQQKFITDQVQVIVDAIEKKPIVKP